MKVFVLVNAAPGKAMELCEQVRKIQGVAAAHPVTGPFDVIVEAEAGSLGELGQLVVSRLQRTGLAERTVTCVVVED